jgi:DNA-binding transcriptional MerR regulator
MSLQRSSETPRNQKRRASGSEPLTIGQLARLTGIHAKAIRYYESIGVLPRPERQSNGYRRYGQADVNRLILLRRLRLLGVPLTALTPLLVDASDARCVEVQHDLLDLVTFRLEALDQQIAELHLLRDQVERYQHQLTDCHPDERESFRVCRDMSCLALPGEMAQEQENYYAHIPNF